MTKKTFYNDKIVELEHELELLKKRSHRISWIRLVLFIAFAATVFFLFKHGVVFYLVSLSFVFLVSFIILAIKHNRIEDYILFLSSKKDVNKDEIQFLNFNFNKRYSGVEFEKMNPFLSNDFNIFGINSLFQYLNRCNTAGGQRLLAKKLCAQEKDTALILKWQCAINELTNKIDFIQNFQSHSKFILQNNNDIRFLVDWTKNFSDKNTVSRVIAIVMGTVNLIWLALSILNIIPWTLIVFPIIVSQLIIFFNRKKSSKYNSINNDIVLSNFTHYSILLRLIEEQQFEAELNQNLTENLNAKETKASVKFAKLFKLLKLTEIQNFALVSIVLNSMFFTDILFYYALNEWKKDNRIYIDKWITTISEMEVYISLATFTFNNFDCISFPKIEKDTFRIEADNMGHPLISPDNRVSNSFKIESSPSVQIITGANMAGKSTFLRTLAVNIILSSCGAPVVARKFIFHPCDIMSSIKVQDSLAKNESYFYAELSRLKDIIEHVKQNPQTLVILDEILRGTNTKDKQTGSLGIVEKLIQLNAIVVIATHDLSIGELENKYPTIAILSSVIF